MPALQRAVALAEMDGAAFAVAEHLDFDVARPLEIFFEIERVVAERRFRLGARRWQAPTRVRSRARTTFMPRPPPPAAALSMTGKPMSRASRCASCVGADAAVGAGHDRNAELLGGALGRDLVAHQADVLGARADEMHVVLGENFGKARVLGEKAVARMHGVGAGDLAGGEQRRDIEVAVLGRRRADADALVGEPHMHGVGVGRRMHRHRRDAELLAGPQHPQRDFSAIGDQDFVEHRGH